MARHPSPLVQHWRRMSEPTVTSPIPICSSNDLLNGIEGDVHHRDPYQPLLAAAFMLTHLVDWMNSDVVEVDDETTGSELLRALGIDEAELHDMVRNRIIVAIDSAPPHIEGMGAAIDAVARAWNHDISHKSAESTDALFEVCCAYDRMARPDYPTWRRQAHIRYGSTGLRQSMKSARVVEHSADPHGSAGTGLSPLPHDRDDFGGHGR